MFFRWVPQVLDLSAPQDLGSGYDGFSTIFWDKMTGVGALISKGRV